MKKFITAVLAVTFLLVFSTDQAGASFTYSQSIDPIPKCGLTMTESVYSAIERDLPAVDFSNKDHSWYIAEMGSQGRLFMLYSESLKIQVRPFESKYQMYLYPLDGKQHFIQYYMFDFSAPISKTTPITYWPSGSFTCYYASQNLVYSPDFYGTQWADVNDVDTTPPSGGDSSAGLSVEQLKGLFDEYIKPSYEVIGSIAAVLTIGAVFYIFYRGIKLVHVRWLH